MAYSRQVERILAGSLNLLPAPDSLPAQDSGILNNFRCDQAGVLRSRQGSSAQAGSAAHTLFRYGDDRYSGEGTSLKHGTSYGTTVATGYDGNPLGFAAYQEWIWVMNRGKQSRVQGSTAYNWSITAPAGAPTTAAGGAGNVTGEVIHYITFYAASGSETSGGPGSTPLTVAAQEVDLTSIPTSADAQVIGRHIYRIGGTLTAPLRVGTIEDNTTTTFTDNLSDEGAQDLSIRMPIDHDGPPAARGVVGPYFGKLVAWSTAAEPARIFWTPTAQPHFFPGSTDAAEGNWLDVGGEGEEVLSITNHTRWLGIYKENSIWRLIGDPDDNDPELVHQGVGPASPLAVVNAGDVDYLVGPDGVYVFDGDNLRKVENMRKVEPLFKGYIVGLSSGVNVNPIDFGYTSKIVCGYRPGELWISYVRSGAGATTANETLVYDIMTASWHRDTRGFNCFFFEGLFQGALATFMGGLSAGGIYVLGLDGVDDAGTDIALYWQSRFLDQGAPDAVKRYGEIAIEYQSGTTPTTLTVEALYDNGSAVSLGTISSATKTWARFRLGTGAQGKQARNIAIRITGSMDTGAYAVSIFKVHLHYYAEARMARSFDSGVLDLGTALPKTVYRFEAHFETTGNVSWDLHSDLPAGTMVTRESDSIANAAGRRTVIKEFTTARDGRYFRLMFFASADFQMHRLRIEVQPMSEYIDANTPFESGVIAA